MSVKVRRNVTVRAEGYEAIRQAVDALAIEVDPEAVPGKAVRLTVETTTGKWGWNKVVAKLTTVREVF